MDTNSVYAQVESIFRKQDRPLGLQRAIIIKLIIIALCVLISSLSLTRLIVLLQQESPPQKAHAHAYPSNNKTNGDTASIFIDISGAVEMPQVYEVLAGTRLYTLVEKAGGFSPTAHRDYIARNFNFSQIVKDGEKYHFPSIFEVDSGVYTEHRKILSAYRNDTLTSLPPTAGGESFSLISINSATQRQLETLPGVGEVTAARIIGSRPYTRVEELYERGVVKESVYEKIAPLIQL
jgi:competence protein ComEA